MGNHENHYAPRLASIADVGDWRRVGDLSSSDLRERSADVAAAAERLREWAAWYAERAGLVGRTHDALADREREFRHDETIARLANELAEFDDEEGTSPDGTSSEGLRCAGRPMVVGDVLAAVHGARAAPHAAARLRA